MVTGTSCPNLWPPVWFLLTGKTSSRGDQQAGCLASKARAEAREVSGVAVVSHLRQGRERVLLGLGGGSERQCKVSTSGSGRHGGSWWEALQVRGVQRRGVRACVGARRAEARPNGRERLHLGGLAFMTLGEGQGMVWACVGARDACVCARREGLRRLCDPA